MKAHLACGPALLLAGLAVAQTQDGAPEPARVRALLVGVGAFPEGAARPSELAGCPNDVRLVRELLTQRFGVPEENIVTLVDEEATLEAIVEQFLRHLVEPATSDTEALFYFTGHGSRIPDEVGEDSSFLAYDSRTGDYRGERDLSDDLLATLRLELTKRTSRAVLITDACHSGGGVRGPKEKYPKRRGIKNTLGLSSFDPSFVYSFPCWPAGVKILDDDDQPEREGFVHVAACGERESAYQILADDGETYGALTWFLCQALREAHSSDTWRDIVERIQGQVLYAAGHRPLPDGAVDREIFGAGFHARVGIPCEVLPGGALRLGRSRLGGVGRGDEFRLSRDGPGGLVELGRARVSSTYESYSGLSWIGPAPDELEAHEVLRAERVATLGQRLRVHTQVDLGEGEPSHYEEVHCDYRLVERDGLRALETLEGVRVGTLSPGDTWQKLDQIAEMEQHYLSLFRLEADAAQRIHLRFVTGRQKEGEHALTPEFDPATGHWRATGLAQVPENLRPVVKLEARSSSTAGLYLVVLSLPEERPFAEPFESSAVVAHLIHPRKLGSDDYRPVSSSDGWTAVGDIQLVAPKYWPTDDPMPDRYLVLAFTERPTQDQLDKFRPGITRGNSAPDWAPLAAGRVELLIPVR